MPFLLEEGGSATGVLIKDKSHVPGCDDLVTHDLTGGAMSFDMLQCDLMSRLG